MATIGRRANNDPCKGVFATLTDILQYGGHISLQSAAALGQMRYIKTYHAIFEDLLSLGDAAERV
jgi:hypothetical protein